MGGHGLDLFGSTQVEVIGCCEYGNESLHSMKCEFHG
jgi:hypothetical protein